MKTKKYLGLIVILTMLFVLLPAASVGAAPAPKVAVCHLDDMGVYHLITISENAFPAHVAHFDASPLELVPNQPGKKFTADCTLINVKDLIDTVVVLSNGSTVYSSASLTSGVGYEFEASGTYKFVNWVDAGIADARCSLRIPGSYNTTGAIAWIDGSVFPSPLTKYLQIWVNNATFEWGSECHPTTHVYVSPFTGLGSTVGFKIVDDAYGDNVGSLTVKIYKYN